MRLLSDEEKFLHDISSPLSVLVFQLETLLQMPLNEEAKVRLEKSLKQVNCIIEMLDGRREALK